MKRLLPVLCGLVLLGGATGCYRMTYKTGLPPGEPAPLANKMWHMGVLNGLAEISQVQTMEQLCPTGVAEIRTQIDLVKGLVNSIIGGILLFHDVTVICAAGGGGSDGPSGYRLQVDDAGYVATVEPLAE